MKLTLSTKVILFSGAILATFIACLLVYIKFQDNDEFLSFIRYKHFGEWKNTGTQYYLSVFQMADSVFAYSVRFSETSERLLVHWNNDSLVQHSLACGYLKPKNPEIKLWGYDPSIISVTDNLITPIKAGSTIAYIKYPNRADTLSLKVIGQKGKLILEERSYY